MFKYVSFLVFLASVLTAPCLPIALADNGESELASVEDLSVQPEVFLVSNQRKKDCARVGTVCLFANGGGTVAGVDVNPTVGIVTTLARGTQFATLSKTDRVPDADTWYVEMIARFRARTSAAPIVVAVMDYSDPEGMDRKEATAVWRIEGSQTKDLGMHLAFSAEDGFQARHTYLVRMVQGVGADERVLAEGNFLLE
jgi:hypothetical protein